jgi:hypothetical protein
VRNAALGAALLVLAGGTAAEGAAMRVVVADLPYARVWEAALRAVEGAPIERAADGVIVTGRVERPPRPEEAGFERVAERVTLRVEAFAERITRVTVLVEAQGWRGGAWVPVPDGAETARAIVDRLRAATG